MAIGGSRAEIENLEIAVPIHPDAVIVYGEEQHIDWTRWIERPGVDALGIDAGLHQLEVVSARPLRQVNSDGQVKRPNRQPRSLRNRVLARLSVRSCRFLRPRHCALRRSVNGDSP